MHGPSTRQLAHDAVARYRDTHALGASLAEADRVMKSQPSCDFDDLPVIVQAEYLAMAVYLLSAIRES